MTDLPPIDEMMVRLAPAEGEEKYYLRSDVDAVPLLDLYFDLLGRQHARIAAEMGAPPIENPFELRMVQIAMTRWFYRRAVSMRSEVLDWLARPDVTEEMVRERAKDDFWYWI